MSSARERIFDAMLDLVLTEGYDLVGEEEVVARAGVSRDDFDRLFNSKEECAIATFDRSLESFWQTATSAYASEDEWTDSLRATGYALADWIVENPREIRFGIVGLLWAGEMAQTRRETAIHRFVMMIDAGRRQARDPDSIPPYTAEGVVGSFAEILTKGMRKGDLDPRPMVPELMYIAVRPYRGDEAAAEELKVPPPPRSNEEE